MSEGSWVGLDVHARSVVAGVIDRGSGEVRSLRVPPGCDATVAWLKTLPAPVRVVYEAGPTGYRLARACAEAAQGEVVSAANLNGPGQVVIGGARDAVKRAGDRAKTFGAKRVVPLNVSAPFHTALMKPAEERLKPELLALAAEDPRVPVVANVDGQLKRDAGAAVDALIRQIVAPVQWEAVVTRLASEGVTTYVEVGPGSVLSGLVRKIDRGATALAFGTPGDLASIESLLHV